MRRRRQHLQVSTFPFLAVLLCAMGSLILLLLVMDRRAKAVARLKLEAALAEAAAQDHDAQAKEQEEWERRRQDLHHQLTRQNEEVLTQIGLLQAKAAQAAQSANEIGESDKKLREQLAEAEAAESRLELQISAKDAASEKAGHAAEERRAEMANLTAELLRLERALKDLKEARRQQTQIYSLVPYGGRRGDTRKPIYVECNRNGAILHPNRFALVGPVLELTELRREIERRLTSSGNTASGSDLDSTKKAYLLLLVRPDGINTYYRVLRALAGLEVDYGYEFLDQDWTVEIPGDGENAPPQPWMLAKTTEVPYRPSANARKVLGLQASGVERPGGQSESTVPRMEGSGGKPGGYSPGTPPYGYGSKSQAVNQGAPGISQGLMGQSSVFSPVNPGMMPQGPASGTARFSAPGVSSPSGDGPFLGNERPAGSGTLHVAGPGPAESEAARLDPPVPLMPGNGSRAGGPASAGRIDGFSNSAQRMPDGGQSGPLAATPAGTGGIAGSSFPAQNAGTSATQQAFQQNGSMPASGAIAGTPSASPQLNGGSVTPGVNPGDASAPSAAQGNPADGPQIGTSAPADALDRIRAPAARKKTVQPLALGSRFWDSNRDWIIAIECRSDGLIITPTREWVPLDSTLLAGGDTQLVEKLRKMIDRRQATVPEGEQPFRPIIRFRVWPSGLRSYYTTYPILEALHLPMVRENVDRTEENKRGGAGL